MGAAADEDDEDHDATLKKNAADYELTPEKPNSGKQLNEGEDEDEEDEPKLKYERLTGNLGAVYRNGDATSSFLVSGDKMVR